MPKLVEEGIKVDMVLTDLPYGTTACSWDSVIPLARLWDNYKSLVQSCKAIVLFSSQPFTSILVNSNLGWFKYSWVWKKNRATGHVHAKNKPMKIHEDICVFSSGNTLHVGQSDNRMPYFPQGLQELPKGTRRRTRNDSGDNTVLGKRRSHRNTEWTHTNYPTSILEFPIEMNSNRFHPTQKPLDLCQYLISTYTSPGELVLDNAMGGGNIGVAARRLGRDFIGIELEKNYYLTAVDRISKEQQ